MAKLHLQGTCARVQGWKLLELSEYLWRLLFRLVIEDPSSHQVISPHYADTFWLFVCAWFCVCSLPSDQHDDTVNSYMADATNQPLQKIEEGEFHKMYASTMCIWHWDIKKTRTAWVRRKSAIYTCLYMLIHASITSRVSYCFIVKRTQNEELQSSSG